MPRNAFYNTATWKRIRAAKLAAFPICQYCGTAKATEVDHRIAINAGADPMDRDNLVSACHECHSRKTLYIERMGRDRVPVRGCDINGKPLDPAHWWNGKASGKGRREIVRPEALQRHSRDDLKKKFAVSERKDRALVQKQSLFAGKVWE